MSGVFCETAYRTRDYILVPRKQLSSQGKRRDCDSHAFCLFYGLTHTPLKRCALEVLFENISVVAEADAEKTGLGNDVGAGVYSLELAGYLFQGNGGDDPVLDGHHVAVFLVGDHLRRLGAQTGGKNPVIGAGSAATLHMAGNGDPDLAAGGLGDLVGNAVGDGGELLQHMGLVFLEFLLVQLRGLLGQSAFRHRDDGEAVAGIGTLLDLGKDGVDVVGDLRDQDDVRAAGHTGVQGQPAGLVAHDLHDEDPVVGGGGGMDAVNDIGGDLNGALETEGGVGAPKVVVDGLGQADDVQAFLTEQVGGLLAAVAAQHHQAVQPQAAVSIFHGLYLVQAVFVGLAHILEGLTAGTQDGAAHGEDAGEVHGGELLVILVDQALVAVDETDQLHAISVNVVKALGHAPQCGVQRLAVSAAGKQSDSFHKLLLSDSVRIGVKERYMHIVA